MAHGADGEMSPYPRKDTSEQGCQHRTLERVIRCPDCGVFGPDLEDVFDDGPPRGIGADGQTHSDPWCAMIAPIGSPEYRRGELCELCIERQDTSDDQESR